MKTLILAGGTGSRLSEETVSRTQADGGDRRAPDPLAHHEALRPARPRDFLVALGYKGEMIKRYFFE